MSETFIHELPLVANLTTIAELNGRLEACRFLYNAILQECLRRHKLMKESKEWQKARNLTDPKEKREAFKKIIGQRKFTEYDIHRYLTDFLRHFPFRGKLDSQCCQKIASRAFAAVKEYSLCKRGRPRYKAVGQFSSLEGKSNITGIRFKNGFVEWKGLKLAVIFDTKDRYGVEANALAALVKYVRLIRRKRNGKFFFFAQLILVGRPIVKHKTPQAIVGIDLGPSTIAVYSAKRAFLAPLTNSNAILHKNLKRKISRSYDKNVKTSCRCQKMQEFLTSLLRKDAQKRKHEIGTLTNNILLLGKEIHLEKLSYKSFQKNYGKSVQKHAPGQFVERLKRKAENAGGKVVEINTYRTKLSQTCICGKVEKKQLSQRTHKCSCGVEAQRDLFSAFLAFHTNDNVLNRRQAVEAWPSAHLLLEQALLRSEQTARIESYDRFERRQSGSPVKDGSTCIEILDVVGFHTPESRKEMHGIAVRTP